MHGVAIRRIPAACVVKVYRARHNRIRRLALRDVIVISGARIVQLAADERESPTNYNQLGNIGEFPASCSESEFPDIRSRRIFVRIEAR